MSRPERVNHTIPTDSATTEAATTFRSGALRNVCQPAASIRLLRRMATAKVEGHSDRGDTEPA